MISIFHGIKNLLTLKKAAKKGGRFIQSEDLSLLRNAAIVSSKGKIVWVGPYSQVPQEYSSRKNKRIDLQAETVLPAFVECHTHAVFAGQRADEFELRNTGTSYQEISRRGGGILSTVKATRQATFDELATLGQKRLDAFLRQGVSTVEIKSGYGLRCKDELKMLEVARSLKKLRVVTTYLGAHAVPREARNAKAYIEGLINKDLEKVACSGLADRADIFIEEGFFDLSLGRLYLEKAKALGLQLTVHADQLHRTGAGKLACELGAASADHLVQANSADIKALSQSSTTAVLLPAADYYLQMKYPPARKMLDAGVRVALASDFNPGSSPTQDLSFVGLLARLEMKMSLPEVLVAYTLNAAYALGKQNCLGSLEMGKECDFSVLSSSWKELFYHVGQSPVEALWSRGRRLWGGQPKVLMRVRKSLHSGPIFS